MKMSFRGIKKFLLCSLVVLSLSKSTYAQVEVTTVGTEFWFGFMQNYIGDPVLTVFISSETVASGTVEMPLTGWSQSFVTSPGVTSSINIPTTAQHVLSGVVENKGIHIQSDEPISVYCINYLGFTSDGSRILPKPFLDIDYVVSAYRGLTGGGGPLLSEMLIVATEDGTEIEITPVCDMLGGAQAGVPFLIQLNQGETYQIQASQSNEDVTGTRVIATEISGDCRPFAVFGGSVCPNVPTNCPSCDHVFDQILPVKVWGTEYFTVPFQGASSYTYKILAAQDGTQVSVDGVPLFNLNMNEFVEVNDESDALFITSNAPICVIQYMEGTTCATDGDPSMLTLNSTNQTMDQVTFATVVSSIITVHNLNIVVSTNAVSSVLLDGLPILASEFTAFPGNPQNSFAQISITQGSHTLQSDDRFVAYVYGTGSAESYAYSTGAKALEPFEPVVNVTCSNGQVILQSDENYQNAWWSTLESPEDTVATGQPFIIEPPILNQIYILHGASFLSGCTSEEFFSVESPENLDVNIEESTIDLCIYQEYGFSPEVLPAGSDYIYEWSAEGAFSVSDELNGVISPFESGYYYLQVSTFSGCSSGQDSVYVNIIGDDVTYFNAMSDELAYCEGDTVFLDAILGFNIGLDLLNTAPSPSMWSDVQGGVLNDVCGSMSGTALYFEGAGTRFAETLDMDVSQGGALSFAIQISDGSGACDGAEFGENVRVEYSTNGGIGWNLLSIMFEGLYPSFETVQLQLPLAAQTASTRFRWSQPVFSAANEDIWMLDNVSVNSFEPSANPFLWTSQENVDDPFSQSTFSVAAQSAYYFVETNSSGCLLMDSVYVDVQSNFDLTITNDTTLCSPGVVQLSVQSAEPGSYTYLWDNPADLNSVFTASPIASISETTTFNVDVTSSAGCVNSEAVTVTIFAEVEPWISSDQLTICEGSVNMEVNVSGNPDEYIFSWSPATLLDDPTLVNVVANPIQTTTFSVFVNDTVNDCTSYAELMITVNNINLELPSDTVLCNSEGVQILYDFNPMWNHLFDWNNTMDLNDPQGAFPTILVPLLNDTLILTLTDLLLDCTVSDTMIVSTQSMTYSAADTLSICPESTVQSEVIGDYVSISWTPSATLDVTDPSAPVFSNELSETFYYFMSSALGCQLEDSIHVLVNLPHDFQIIMDDTLCEGLSILLDNPLEEFEYLWNTSETTEDIWVNQGGIYAVQVTDSAGCELNAQIWVVSNALPEFEIVGDNDLCIGESTMLTAQITDVDYLWSDGSMDQSADFDLPISQIVWAEATDIMGCVFRDSMDVVVRSLPALDLYVEGAICEDTAATVIATAEGVTYLWETNETSEAIDVLEEGYYAVTVTDEHACERLDSIYVEQIIFPLEQALDTFYCQGSSVIIRPEVYPDFDISWSTGLQADTLLVNTEGNYVMILNNENCEKWYPFMVQYEANPMLSLQQEGMFCSLDIYNGIGFPLHALSDGEVHWEEGIPGDTTLNIFHEGIYAAIAYGPLGCTTDRSIEVTEQCLPYFYIPSAFSPNDDGVNDHWKVETTGIIDKYNLVMFDRWGNTVFQSSDPHAIWNGSVNGGDHFAKDGVYNYVIEYEAYTRLPKIIAEKIIGHVTILR